MTSISSFDTENVIAPLNANANAGNEELKGYQVAAYIAGVVAATPANQSVTHATLSRYSVLNEILTNTEMEVAEEKGCLVLSTASDGAVWLDNGVNTLVHPDANHDSGWKKIRRTKTRYELLNRANAAADALVGKVDNDTNGRATIMAAIQGICNAMEAEGKIQYGNVTESSTVTTDGDTCGFDIEVIDLDSAEHIYLNYYSAHVYVDDTEAYQATPFDRGAWHVGVNYGGRLFGICNNHNSIGIEMCVQAGYNYDKAFQNTVEVCKMLMQKFGIDADHVVSHYDVCAKNCPSAIRAKGDWNRFKQLIGAKTVDATVDKYYRIRKSWPDSKSQIGAYKNLENAKKDWKEGYTIFDWNGKAVYPEQKKDTSSSKTKVSLTEKLNIQLPVLQSGAEGSAVRCLQAILGVSVDGDFGKNTKTALKTFQKNVGIDDDGCCGQNTWKKIADHMNANTFK